MEIKNLFNTWGFVIILCLILGLAPYSPEPHLLGKLRWVLGGAKGMVLIDWGDLLLHAFPWLLLLRLIVLRLFRGRTQTA